jgi:hypothetical protein
MSEREGLKLDAAAIRARAEAATPGWFGYYSLDQSVWTIQAARGWLFRADVKATEADVRFAVAAREDIPALLDALASERARADALWKILNDGHGPARAHSEDCRCLWCEGKR